MAKESTTTTRIPRFDSGSGSRIPLPGSLRTYNKNNNINQQNNATSNLLMGGGGGGGTPSINTAAAAKHRPTSMASLTPPLIAVSNLKKSSSVERLNNAMNIVSKRTTTALKKFFGKPQQKQLTPLNNQKSSEKPNVTVTLHTDGTPRSSLMRSDTFIRSNNDLSLLGTPAGCPKMAQSTPAPTSCKIANQKNLPAAAGLLGKTMTIVSPIISKTKQPKRSGIAHYINNNHVDVTQIMKTGKSFMSSPGVATPATDATFSNPGSTDNLPMIDDVSMPSDFDLDDTLQPSVEIEAENCAKAQLAPPDKSNLKLPLNSTVNTERLLELSQQYGMPTSPLQLMNFTPESLGTAQQKNTTQLLYMTQNTVSASATPDIMPNLGSNQSVSTASPFSMKSAQSELVLPTRTPDDILLDPTAALINKTGEHTANFEQNAPFSAATSLQDVNNLEAKARKRFSFGMDLTESTLDCSIELIDISLSSTVLSQPHATALAGQSAHIQPSPSAQHLQVYQQTFLKKQSSFDMDESLGILTPDQMKDFMDSTTANTNNLELPVGASATAACVSSTKHQISLHQMRMDQTPSPEDLPLDPVEVKTELGEIVVSLSQQQHQTQQAAFTKAAQQQQQQQQDQELQQQPLQPLKQAQMQHLQTSSSSTEPVSLHTDTEFSKTEPIMTKSNVSKISTSFITSVTSVTSLDTGYQGDGEMSRPASRGAGDHSPSNGPHARRSAHVSRQPSFNQMQHQPPPPVRRQDPMTDSDFFTESDADDLLHRGGDRRAQVIDGQLYNCPTLQSAASVFISEDPQMEDSCMESSGIFTDVENRGDEDLAQMRRQDTQASPLQDNDMSPDGEAEDSTETVKSNRDKCGKHTINHGNMEAAIGQGQFDTSSNTIANSCSVDRLSAATTLSNRTSYCSVEGEYKSFSSLEEAFERERIAASSSVASCEPNMKHTKSSNAGKIAGKSAAGGGGGGSASCVINNKPNGARGNTAQSQTKSTAPTTSLSSSVSKRNVAVANRKNSRALLKTGTSAECDIQTDRQKIGIINQQNSGKCNNSGSDNSKSASPQNLVRKSPQAPNKWDAVMNKIESNKSVIRKNYNDVKSKVSTTRVQSMGSAGGTGMGTGTGTPTTPTSRRTPTSVLSSGGPTSPVSGSNKNQRLHRTTPPIAPPAKKPTDTGSRQGSPQTLQSKRLLQGAAKRGRSNSSQKSSQSDLSMASGAGSPKILAKTPLRAAKKRDVRNLSISPTDLGPPPKAQQKANGATTRGVKSALTTTESKKRALLSSTTSSTSSTFKANHTSSASSSKSSSTSPLNARNKTSPTATTNLAITAAAGGVLAKAPNRLSSIEQNSSPPINGHSPEPPTELKEITCNGLKQQQQQQHNSNNNINNNNNKELSQVSTTTRTNSINSVDLETSSSPPTAAKQLNGIAKSSPKLHQTGRKTLLQKQQPKSVDKIATVTASAAGFLDATELQRLKLLNRHSCNGRLDFESIERHLQATQAAQLKQDKGVQALAVVVQYLAHELDAFSCPKFKNESLKAKEALQNTLQLLDAAKSSCSQLQEQICEKDAYYTQREENLQSLHRSELEEARLKYNELQKQAKEEIAGLEHQLSDRDAEHKRLLNDLRLEMNNKFAEQLQQLTATEERERELQERLASVDAINFDLTAKCSLLEKTAAKNAKAATERERLLNERISLLGSEMEALRKRRRPSPVREREPFKNSTELSHDEIAILRPHTYRASLDSSRVQHQRTAASSRASLPTELQRLQNEVESLRCVLEMRQSEISKMSKQNEELLRDADERAAMSTKISMMSAHIEMLKSELETKTEREKEYITQLDELQKIANHEKCRLTRLTFDKESLQYQLKQRSEQLHIVEAKLSQTLNSSNSLNVSSLHCSQSNYSSSSSLAPFHTENTTSPPLSPIIKGVIEKADSVAYVLEMDDETPEVAASKMVKRASSFRSIERSPVTRRQLSLSASAAAVPTTTSSTTATVAPNPLSQSMSAASVIHSIKSTKQARVRSRSVSVKDETQSAVMPNMMNESNNLLPPVHDVMRTSSPYANTFNNKIRPRTSTIKVETIPDEDHQTNEGLPPLFKRNVITNQCPKPCLQQRLITCDSSALISGERLDEHMLPSHPSLHDLKVPKQCLAVKESAGEAMVSGANSEDEGCSASSDDLVSMHSSTSTDISAANAHINIEQVLLMDKINSLSGTPMEMSWSDDIIEPIAAAPIAALNGSSEA